jgi:hypothetical protein
VRIAALSILVASLALAAGGATSLLAQPYQFVTMRGDSQSGQLRRFELSADGQITQVQQINLPEVSDAIEMDPFGRFVIVPRIMDFSAVIEVYEISPSGPLSLASVASREGWIFYEREHTLTPDASLYITLSRHTAASQEPFFFEALSIEPDFSLTENPGKLFLDPDLSPTIPFSVDILGCVTLPLGHLLMHHGRLGGFSYITTYPVSTTGAILSPEQQFIFNSQPITGGWAIRPDQQIAVTGRMGEAHLTSYAVSPDGVLTPIDTYTLTEFGGFSAVGLNFHPSGLSIFSAASAVPITVTGEFYQQAFFLPEGVALENAVSPDGKLAVTIFNVDGAGSHWGVYAVTPTGQMTLLKDNIFPFGYRDIAFIPPRTEDILGDANGDGLRNIQDVVKLVNHLDGTQAITGPVPLARADATQDGTIDEDDLVWIVDFLLGLNP